MKIYEHSLKEFFKDYSTFARNWYYLGIKGEVDIYLPRNTDREKIDDEVVNYLMRIIDNGIMCGRAGTNIYNDCYEYLVECGYRIENKNRKNHHMEKRG